MLPPQQDIILTAIENAAMNTDERIAVDIPWYQTEKGLRTFCAALVIVGLSFSLSLHEGFFHNLGEALFLAGVLSGSVDYFLKKQMQKDASAGIFHHLLGFDLPLEINEALRQFLNDTRAYRLDMRIEAKASMIGEFVKLIISSRHKVIISGSLPIQYSPVMEFEESENPELLEVVFTAEDEGDSFSTDKPQVLTRRESEPEVFYWDGSTTGKFPKSLLPRKTYWASVRYSVTLPKHSFHVLNFGRPTIGTTIKLDYDPAELNMTASIPDQKNGEEYIYKRVLIRADHLQIRWSPQAIKRS